MRAVDRVFLQAKHLSPEERRELSERLREEPPSTPLLDEAALRAIAYFTEQPKWMPPPRAPSVVELLREDRAR